MNEDTYIKRAMDAEIIRAVKTHKAVLVTGARQVGKSTSIKENLIDIKMVTLDDPFLEDQAKADPAMFMKLNPPPLAIDEVQYAPILFRYVKMACDKTRRKGLYCLSGSQPYELMRGVTESLAGRVRIIEMCTLSLREIAGDRFNRHFLPTEDYIRDRMKSATEPADIWKTIHRGGYPEVQDESVRWNEFYSDYVKTHLEREVRALAAVQDLGAFRRFMVALASRTGEVLNYANIAEEVGKDAGTVRSWTSVMESSGLVYLLRPYASSELKRAIKSPKLYFRDTGLASYLTRWLTPETLAAGAMAGHMFETFVVSEILKSYANEGLDCRDFVTYYRGRDRKKVMRNGIPVEVDGEIDLVLEENGILHPVEIKLSANPQAVETAAFQVLDSVKDMRRGQGAVVCMCSAPGTLRANVWALPYWMI